MKNILILLMTFVLSTSFIFDYGDYGEPNYVYWESSNGLKWDHFKGRPHIGSSHHAYSMLGLAYEVKSNTATEVTFLVSAYLDKSNSWVKQGQKTDRLLKHEQKHFDICELHRRMFVKELTDIEFFTYANINSKIKNIFNDINNKVDRMQVEYDRETQHSRVEVKQKEWDQKIADLLLQYETHTAVEIKVDLRK